MNDNKGTFDRLVAGLSSSDRKMMLNKINKTIAPTIKLVDSEQELENQNITLKIAYENESIFYKIYVWLKCLMEKRNKEQIYNEDIITRLAKKVNRDHPGIVNHKIHYLDMVFYQRIIALKEAADFFRPYIQYVKQNPGDFYVYLSSFVTPELVESINRNADPFTISFDEDPDIEKRNDLLKKLDELLNNFPGNSRANLYEAVSAVNWLINFSNLPLIHLCSQFTNIAGDSYTCPYKNSRNDYDILAALFSSIETVSNEILEAIFLYSKKREIDGNENVQDKDIESAIKQFLTKANGNLAKIQIFISAVPVMKVGKIINDDYNWTCGSAPGAESWFNAFRLQWRKIIDIRWNEWIRERKKYLLSSNLRRDFNLEEFPAMPNKPWEHLWLRVPFSCELTGGFVCWFSLEKFNSIIPVMNDVMLEGVFLRNENRTEYSEALNIFVEANKEIIELNDRLSSGGDYGQLFEEFTTSKVRTLQVQNQIDSMMASTESSIHDCVSKIIKSCKSIDLIYTGFFSEQKDGTHDGLQNLNTIKGHGNRVWKDKLSDIHIIIKKLMFYLEELEPIDAATREGTN